MRTQITVTLSKEFLALLSPQEQYARMTVFHQAIGDLLLGRQNKLLTGRTGVKRLKPPPLERSFGKWYKGNDRVSRFEKYKGTTIEKIVKRGKKKGQVKVTRTSEYEQEKKAKGLKNFLIYSGALYADAITHARISASSRSVTISARQGRSKDYQMVHQLGSKVMPKRPPYLIDDTDKKSMILPLTTVLLSLFRGSLGTVKMR